MTVGDRIKQRRLELELTVDDLANRLEKNRATIYRYENNDIKNMPTTVLEPLADALYTTPAYLMGWTDEPHDWERIANDNGICSPNDYDGDPEDWCKMKIAQEHDGIADECYDTYTRERINKIVHVHKGFSSEIQTATRSYDNIAQNDTERKLLMVCRKAGNVSDEEKDAIINQFEATIDVYLKAKGIKGE